MEHPSREATQAITTRGHHNKVLFPGGPRPNFLSSFSPKDVLRSLCSPPPFRVNLVCSLSCSLVNLRLREHRALLAVFAILGSVILAQKRKEKARYLELLLSLRWLEGLQDLIPASGA